jgi:hypothetical protein
MYESEMGFSKGGYGSSFSKGNYELREDAYQREEAA